VMSCYLLCRQASVGPRDRSRSIRCSLFMWVMGWLWTVCCQVSGATRRSTLERSCHGVSLHNVCM